MGCREPEPAGTAPPPPPAEIPAAPGAVVPAAAPEETSALAPAQPLAPAASLRLGSASDVNTQLICELARQSLQAAGFGVEGGCGTGTPQEVRRALLAGQIDLAPEWTGTGLDWLRAAGKEVPQALSHDAELGYQALQELDQRMNRLTWLGRAPVNAVTTVAVPEVLAEQYSLTSFVDLARYVGAGGELHLTVTPEFAQGPLAALERSYGFSWQRSREPRGAGAEAPHPRTSMDFLPAGLPQSGTTPPELRDAQQAAARQDQPSAVMMAATDGTQQVLGLRPLTDPAGALTVQQPAFTVRQEVLKTAPRLSDVLTP
ncbi:glycine betaine ABC transporter substrate-binding protein [Deinococcus lacus]|uniref:Glycine betaine ABC transporter substrate-binding protein n=1 Tax=Deinococcus lacus TaxID=392561 RepID=A0ABW1YD73_9DEIO